MSSPHDADETPIRKKRTKRGATSKIDLKDILGTGDIAEERKRRVCAGHEGQDLQVTDMIDDAPAAVRGHLVPLYHFMVNAAIGTWKLTANHKVKLTPLIETPILITAIDQDINTGAKSFRLAWRVGRAWKFKWVPRAIACNADKLKQHADTLPISSASASGVARFLELYESRNQGRIQVLRSSSRFGWLGQDGDEGFLCGRFHVRRDGSIARVDLEDSDSWQPDAVAFRAAEFDHGAEQLANALAPKGSFEAWRELVRKLEPHPLASFALVMGFASPLVAIVGSPNPMAEWAFPSTTGKTTTLRIASSIYADPRDEGGYIKPWSSTIVFIERTAVTLKNLPVILDDSAQVRDSDNIGIMLYDLYKGVGKPRGNKTGTDSIEQFQLSVMSSGERPASAFVTGNGEEKGGAKARLIQICRYPFGSAEQGHLATTLAIGLSEHHGTAGQRWLSWLALHRDEWPAWRQWLHNRSRQLALGAENNVRSRAASIRALLELTYEKANEALGIRLPNPLDEVWAAALEGTVDVGGTDSALEVVKSWVHSNPSRFEGLRSTHGSFSDREGRWGACINGEDRDGQPDEWMLFDPALLRTYLRTCGHSWRAVAPVWKADKLLKCDDDHFSYPRKLLGRESQRFVHLPLNLFFDQQSIAAKSEGPCPGIPPPSPPTGRRTAGGHKCV